MEEGAPLLEKGNTYLLFLKKGALGGYGVTDATTAYEKRGDAFVRTGKSENNADIPHQIPVNEAAALVKANDKS